MTRVMCWEVTRSQWIELLFVFGGFGYRPEGLRFLINESLALCCVSVYFSCAAAAFMFEGYGYRFVNTKFTVFGWIPFWDVICLFCHILGDVWGACRCPVQRGVVRVSRSPHGCAGHRVFWQPFMSLSLCPIPAAPGHLCY